MRYARVRFEYPGGRRLALHDLLVEGVLDRVELLAGGVADTDTPTYTFSVAGDLAETRAALAECERVLHAEVAADDDGSAIVYTQERVDGVARALREAVTHGTVVTMLPVVFHADGTATFGLVGTAEDLGTAVEETPERVDVAVERVGPYTGWTTPVLEALTGRQREALQAGLAVGYYDVPRTGDHEDVAAALDCAPSTAAEHLRKAEAALVAAVLGGPDEA